MEKGKEFDLKGNLIFKGEYLNGKKAKGKIQYSSPKRYEGEFDKKERYEKAFNFSEKRRNI